MDLFNQLTVGLKEQQQLKVEFVESLTELQLLKDRKVVVSKRCLWGGFLFLLLYYFILYQGVSVLHLVDTKLTCNYSRTTCK